MCLTEHVTSANVNHSCACELQRAIDEPSTRQDRHRVDRPFTRRHSSNFKLISIHIIANVIRHRRNNIKVIQRRNLLVFMSSSLILLTNSSRRQAHVYTRRFLKVVNRPVTLVRSFTYHAITRHRTKRSRPLMTSPHIR